MGVSCLSTEVLCLIEAQKISTRTAIRCPLQLVVSIKSCTQKVGVAEVGVGVAADSREVNVGRCIVSAAHHIVASLSP